MIAAEFRTVAAREARYDPAELAAILDRVPTDASLATSSDLLVTCSDRKTPLFAEQFASAAYVLVNGDRAPLYTFDEPMRRGVTAAVAAGDLRSVARTPGGLCLFARGDAVSATP